MFSEFRKYPCHLSEENFLFATEFKRFSELRIPCHLWKANRFHLTPNCRAIFQNNITKLVSKCRREINEQLLKTSRADVRPGKKYEKKPQRVRQPAPPTPFALIRRRVKLEFPVINFSLRKQPSVLTVLVLRTYHQEFATENGQETSKRRPF